MREIPSIFERGTPERTIVDIQLSNYTGVSCPICGQPFDHSDDIRIHDGRKGLGSDVVCFVHWNQYAEENGIERRI